MCMGLVEIREEDQAIFIRRVFDALVPTSPVPEVAAAQPDYLLITMVAVAVAVGAVTLAIPEEVVMRVAPVHPPHLIVCL